MKLTILAFSMLLALSSNTSADWFEGWNNTNTQGSGIGNTSGWSTGSGDGSGTGQGNVSGWGTGKGDADGEVNFSLSFKGKGRTNMDTKISGDGATDFAGNIISNAATSGNTAGNFVTGGTGFNNNGYGTNPWNSSSFSSSYGYAAPQQRIIPPVQMMPATPQAMPYGYMPMYMPQPPQAPSFKEILERQQVMRQQMQAQTLQHQRSKNPWTSFFNEENKDKVEPSSTVEK